MKENDSVLALLMAANAGGGGGASSLSDLSDIDISNPANNDILRYNYAEEKWANTSIGQAIRGVTGNDDVSGVLTIGDATNLFVNTGIFLTNELAASIMMLIQAAIANGQYSTESPASNVGQLINRVLLNTSLNAPTYLNIIPSSPESENISLSLLSCSNTSAAWVGCYMGITKVYRVTLFASLGEAAAAGIVAVKAEELMTLDID